MDLAFQAEDRSITAEITLTGFLKKWRKRINKRKMEEQEYE